MHRYLHREMLGRHMSRDVCTTYNIHISFLGFHLCSKLLMSKRLLVHVSCNERRSSQDVRKWDESFVTETIPHQKTTSAMSLIAECSASQKDWHPNYIICLVALIFERKHINEHEKCHLKLWTWEQKYRKLWTQPKLPLYTYLGFLIILPTFKLRIKRYLHFEQKRNQFIFISKRLIHIHNVHFNNLSSVGYIDKKWQ